jgi:hypothetical protein
MTLPTSAAALNAEDLRQLCAQLVDWYWLHGRRREPDHALGSGTWLNQVCDIGAVASSLQCAGAEIRPCQAIWGPSQSGKSSLLSRYLDRPAAGFASALQWSGTEPVLFVGREDPPPGFIALNTYQGKSDASGCATRFVLQRAVPDPAHPVELRLATDGQILQALAIGYLTDCEQGRVGETPVQFDQQQFGALLAAREDVSSHSSLNRAAYERLYHLATVIEELILAGWPRFAGLAPHWENISARLLESTELLGSSQAVDDFAAEVLWDRNPALTNFYAKLCTQRALIARLTGQQPIFCSYAAAAFMLNIAAYRQLIQTGKDRDKILALRATREAQRYLIGRQGPQPAFESELDFGLWQGLVWEMVVPVNQQILAQTSPEASAFLEQADLLDFPGVALAHAGGFKKPPEQMSESEFLTDVLKSGKTASIVATRSRRLEIAGFALFNQFQDPPAQPDQLISGIRAWARHLGLSLGDPAVPLSVVLTFGAKPVNEQIFQLRLQREGIDFSGVLGWLEKLGPLTDPAKVPFFTTTYPHLPQGRINGSTEEIERAAHVILESAAFKRWFRSPDSFLAMTRSGSNGDGGTDFLLRQLGTQVRASRLPALWAARLKVCQERLTTLLSRALPANPKALRAEELQRWREQIEANLAGGPRAEPEADAAFRVCAKLRRFVSVDPEVLEMVPQETARLEVQDYLQRQFRRWRESQTERPRDWNELGLADSSVAIRVQGYLSDFALKQGELGRWVRQNLGHLTSRSEATGARRFLAIKMADLLCFGARELPVHRDFSPDERAEGKINSEFIDVRLRGFAEREIQDDPRREPSDSPYFKSFLGPFLDHLTQVGATDSLVRPPQPGDAELRKLQMAAGLP